MVAIVEETKPKKKVRLPAIYQLLAMLGMPQGTSTVYTRTDRKAPQEIQQETMAKAIEKRQRKLDRNRMKRIVY